MPRTLHSEVIYRGKVFNVRIDQVELAPGKITKLDIVQHNGAIVMVPVDSEGNVWFVEQYRHAAGETLLELPAGTLEAAEDPLSSAQRELREETGMAASRLIHLGEFYIAPGYSTEYLHVYLAEGLTPAPLPQDEDEMLQIVKVPINQVFQWVPEKKIRDAKTLAALLLAKPTLIKMASHS
ncbi:MAG: NUDIX hydrolase [Anaerolineales bacterium]|nr:NUDIX hydrolase [Anaerolineales bacterium]MCS7246960.1 NUDIX hydrolase [Anaerolineales bacterium]MDW8160771.1 NUDIX hydrolase [Anaerolineales bacterium]MDW8445725.1 NUDIX hydrolase [Anaerolineales bacterium]